jgi:uncharacterized protein YllA (UPF0747 family)
VVERYEKLADEAEKIDPQLGQALGGLRNRGLIDARNAERKIIRSIKRRDGESFQQLDRVLDSLRPNGVPQDRALNVLPFIARHGERFYAEVRQAIEVHWRLPG